MATKKPRPRQLQISAWFQHLGVGDAEIGEKIGVLRETVWRWRKEPWRLDPDKIQRLADALGIKPAQLWYPPTRESLDAMLDDSDEETRKMAADIVRRMVQK